MTLRNYTAKPTLTAIAASNGTLTAVATTCILNSVTNLPAAPFTAVFEYGSATNEEVVLVTAVNTGTSTVTITRGYDGTTGVSHAVGASFQHSASAIDFAEANSHVNTALTAANIGAGTYPAGTFNYPGTLQEGGNRVYSAGNAPPYPVSSVAGRTGAVTLTANDVASGTFPGDYTFSTATDGMLTLTGGTSGNTTWLYGHISGTQKFRVHRNGKFLATEIELHGGGDVLSGTTTFSVTTAGVMNASSQVQENGTRVYSANNPPPYPVTSVAGRTGAVTLTAADIGSGVFPTGHFVFKGSTNTDTLSIYNNSDATYVRFRPKAGGGFDVVNSAGTTAIMQLSNAGSLTVASLTVTGSIGMSGGSVYGSANPPPYPVTSVAGDTGAVTLVASDIGDGTFSTTALTLASGLVSKLQIGSTAAAYDLAGAWQTWTHNWRGVTSGTVNPGSTGSIDAYYKVIGKTCFVRLHCTFGGTGIALGSGNWQFDAPVAARNTPQAHGPIGYGWDSSASNGYDHCRVSFSGTTVFQMANCNPNGSTRGTANGVWDGATPFAWATGDQLHFQFAYEIA